MKDIEALDGTLLAQVGAAIRSLAENPHPPGALKLSDEENGYRVRVRDVRILYRLDNRVKEIVVYRVKHRREVYRH